jgi:hypothetical protein
MLTSFGFPFIKLGYILFINSSKMIGNIHAVLNLNPLFLKLNRFICNQLPVLPHHWSRVTPTYLIPQEYFYRITETDIKNLPNIGEVRMP